MSKPLKCKGCGQQNHPYYHKKYDGYCLDCSNCGVPDRDMDIARYRAALERIANFSVMYSLDVDTIQKIAREAIGVVSLPLE